MRYLVSLMAAPLAVAVLLAAGLARADTIDGTWCHADGRRLSINGAQLTMPGGKQIEGDNDRHGFAYVVPPFETDAGATISLVLNGGAQMRIISPTQPDQLWRRCS